VSLVAALRAQFDPEVSHRLERLAARAWPADEVQEVEGWLLRRTEGVDRRRCNSLLPPADPAHAARTLDLALASAEELDFAAVIQVSPAEGHSLLDDALDARGMQASGPSLVLAGPISGAAALHGVTGRGQARARPGDARLSHPDGASAGRAAPARAMEVRLSELDGHWVDAWRTVGGLTGTAETAELVLSQLGDRARFAVAADVATGSPLAVGIGVVEEGWLGLFSLATAPAARRRGLATDIVDALEAWALTRDAHGVYLQVERDNPPALAFYARRGLHIAHAYHYRSA
jgi:GNAT superfamily N-acetyltransferase